MIPNMMSVTTNNWQSQLPQTLPNGAPIQMTRTIVQETIQFQNPVYHNPQGMAQQNVFQTAQTPNYSRQYQMTGQPYQRHTERHNYKNYRYNQQSVPANNPQYPFGNGVSAQVNQNHQQSAVTNNSQYSIQNVATNGVNTSAIPNQQPPSYNKAINGMQQVMNNIGNNYYQAVPNENGFITVKKPRVKTTPVGSGPKISVRNFQSLNKVAMNEITVNGQGANGGDLNVPQVTGDEDFESVLYEGLNVPEKRQSELNGVQQAGNSSVNVNVAGPNGLSFVIPNVQNAASSVINRSSPGIPMQPTRISPPLAGRVTQQAQPQRSSPTGSQTVQAPLQGRLNQQIPPPVNSPTGIQTVQAPLQGGLNQQIPPPVNSPTAGNQRGSQIHPQKTVQPPRISPSDLDKILGNQSQGNVAHGFPQNQVPISTPNNHNQHVQITHPPTFPSAQPSRVTPPTVVPSQVSPSIRRVSSHSPRVQANQSPEIQMNHSPGVQANKSTIPPSQGVSLSTLLQSQSSSEPPQRNHPQPTVTQASSQPRPPMATHHGLPKTIQGPTIPPTRRPSIDLNQSRLLLGSNVFGRTPVSNTSNQPESSNSEGNKPAKPVDRPLTIGSIFEDFLGTSTEKPAETPAPAETVVLKQPVQISIPEQPGQISIPEPVQISIPEPPAETPAPKKSAETSVPAVPVPEKSPDSVITMENRSIAEFIFKEISKNKFTPKKEKPAESSPLKTTTREKSRSVFSPPPQPKPGSSDTDGTSPPYSIQDCLETCDILDMNVELTLIEPGSSKKKQAETEVKRPVKKPGPKCRTMPAYEKQKEEFDARRRESAVKATKKPDENATRKKPEENVTRKPELKKAEEKPKPKPEIPRKYVHIAPKPATAPILNAVEVPAAKKPEVPAPKKPEVPAPKKPEVPAPKKPEVPAPKKPEVHSVKKPEILKPVEKAPASSPAKSGPRTWLDLLKNSEKHFVSMEEPTPSTSKENSKPSTSSATDATKINFNVINGKGPYSNENFNTARKSPIAEESKKSKKTKSKSPTKVSAPKPSTETSSSKLSKETSAPKPSKETSAPKPSKETSAPKPSKDITPPKPSTEISAPEKISASKRTEEKSKTKSKSQTEPANKTPSQTEIPTPPSVETETEPAKEAKAKAKEAPEAKEASSEVSSWTNTSDSDSWASCSSTSPGGASKRKQEEVPSTSTAPPSKKSKSEGPTTEKSADDASNMAKTSTNKKQSLNYLAFEKLKLYYIQEENKENRKRAPSSEEESSKSRRRKISKTEVVRNKNIQRENISLVSKDFQQKLAEKKDEKSRRNSVEGEPSVSKNNDSNNNNSLEDVKPSLEALTSEESKSSNETEFAWVSAFLKKDTQKCFTCAKFVPTPLFWMNLKRQELKCSSCLPQVIEPNVCTNSSHATEISNLKKELHAVKKANKKLQKKLKKVNETESNRFGNKKIDKIRENILQQRRILLEDSSSEDSD